MNRIILKNVVFVLKNQKIIFFAIIKNVILYCVVYVFNNIILFNVHNVNIYFMQNNFNKTKNFTMTFSKPNINKYQNNNIN